MEADTDPQPNIRQNLGSPVEKGEEGSEEPEGKGTPQEHSPQNQLSRPHGSSEIREPVGV